MLVMGLGVLAGLVYFKVENKKYFLDKDEEIEVLIKNGEVNAFY